MAGESPHHCGLFLVRRFLLQQLPGAVRELARMDRQAAQRILRFLHERLALLADPRSIGEALRGPRLDAFWKYRVGGYRIVAGIEDRELIILVVRIGDRKEVYRK